MSTNRPRRAPFSRWQSSLKVMGGWPILMAVQLSPGNRDWVPHSLRDQPRFWRLPPAKGGRRASVPAPPRLFRPLQQAPAESTPALCRSPIREPRDLATPKSGAPKPSFARAASKRGPPANGRAAGPSPLPAPLFRCDDTRKQGDAQLLPMGLPTPAVADTGTCAMDCAAPSPWSRRSSCRLPRAPEPAPLAAPCLPVTETRHGWANGRPSFWKPV
jgi:hypothetical protein